MLRWDPSVGANDIPPHLWELVLLAGVVIVVVVSLFLLHPAPTCHQHNGRWQQLSSST